MKDYQETFKQEFGIHFSESELQFALAFIEEVYQAGLEAGLRHHNVTLVEPHLPSRPINSERD
jgi:hypothetical protein